MVVHDKGVVVCYRLPRSISYESVDANKADAYGEVHWSSPHERPSKNIRSWWRFGWPGGVGQLFMPVFLLMATLYRNVERQLKLAQHKITELNAELENRDEKLQMLITTVTTLKRASEENERRMEMQQNELKQQRTALRELFTAQKMKGGLGFCDYYFTASATAGENSRAFWVLRKHQRNLVMLSRPYTKQIIEAAMEKGLVSENIGKCAVKCSIPNHDCMDGFYKALLVRVGESPDVLEAFLYLMQQKLKESQPCCQLFSKMLDEISNHQI